MLDARITRLPIAAAALVMLMASSAAAQNSANAWVTATLEPVVLITSSGETNFGSIPNLPGLSVVIDPLQPGPGRSVAQFQIPYVGAPEVEVWVPCQIPLNNMAGHEGAITFQALLGLTMNDDVHWLGGCDESLGFILQLGPGAELWVMHLGGSLTIPPGLPSEQYAGSYTVMINVPGY